MRSDTQTRRHADEVTTRTLMDSRSRLCRMQDNMRATEVLKSGGVQSRGSRDISGEI
jgi:hypothetical protein